MGPAKREVLIIWIGDGARGLGRVGAVGASLRPQRDYLDGGIAEHDG